MEAFKIKHIFPIIVLFLSIPFLIVPILLFINSYTLFPPLPGVEYREWVGFLGSYLGGSITLCGVYLSHLYTNKNRVYDAEKQKIKKESEVIIEHITQIDLSVCLDVLRDCGKSTRNMSDNTVYLLEDIIDKIDKKIENILKIDSFLNKHIDILYRSDACSNCDKKCDLYEIKLSFIENYGDLNRVNNLSAIRDYIKQSIDLLKIIDDGKNNFIKSLYLPKNISEEITSIEDKQKSVYSHMISAREEILDVMSTHNIHCQQVIFPLLLDIAIRYENMRILTILKRCPNASRRIV